MASSQAPADIKTAIETTLRAFIAAYKDSAAENNAALINRDVTADCTRQLLPASLLEFFGAPPDHLVDNNEYERLTANDLEAGGAQRSSILDLIIDAAGRKAAFRTVTDMVFKDGETLVMEHCWFLYFTEDGSKVKKVVEFCDADSVKKLMARVNGGGENA